MAGADETVSRSRDQERRELIGGATKSAPLMTGGGVGSSSGHASRINSVLAAEAIQDNSATSQVLKSLHEDRPVRKSQLMRELAVCDLHRLSDFKQSFSLR